MARIQDTDLKKRAEALLTDNILPFWSTRMPDYEYGGFYGRMDGTGQLHPRSAKGAVLTARLLWSFSAASRVLGDSKYLEMASRAMNYLLDHFYDDEFGGVYWSLNCDGTPLDTKKQFYALGFAIYGLSEYYRATSDGRALEYAVRLFHTIEEHSYDPLRGGYVEACTRDWKELSDMRLSGKDENEKKTMNTHLHILEPYTNLYRIWPAPELREALIRLLKVFTERIIDGRTHHLGLFFDEEWNRRERGISFGHDIEASWLLREAAESLSPHGPDSDAGERLLTALRNEVEKNCSLVFDAAMEGFRPDGSMIYELRNDGTPDTERHWWVQAETVTGLLWQHTHTGEGKYLELCGKTLNYIEDHLMIHGPDGTHASEWYWSVLPDGSANTADDRAGFWKCPYHNTRMCLEILEHL